MSKRNWGLGSHQDWREKLGMGQLGSGFIKNGRADIRLPPNHWTYRVEGKAKPAKHTVEREEDEAELDLELDQLEQYEAYQAEASDVEELFK